MKCPQCGQDNDKVKGTRKKRDATVIRRRRVCERCGFVYHTIEQSEQYLKDLADAVKAGMSEMMGKNGDGP